MIGTQVAAVMQNEEANLETCHFVRVLCDLCHVIDHFQTENVILNRENLPKFIFSSSHSCLILAYPLQYAVIYYTRNIPRKILILLTLFLVIRFHTPPQYAVYYLISQYLQYCYF